MSSIIVRSARIAMPLGNIANLRVSVDRSLATAGGPAAGVVATAAVTAQGISIILPQITLYTTWDAPDATTQQAQYTAELVDSLGNVLVRFDGLNPFQLRLANTQTTWKEIQDWNEFYRQSKFLTPNEVPGQYDTEPLQLPGNNIFLGQQSNSATDTMGIYAGNTDNPPGLRFNVATQVWEYSTDGTTWMAIGSGGGGGGSPAGPVNAVQFNNAGSFGGSADFTYNSTTNSLSLGSSVTPGGFRLVGLTGNYWNLASQNPAGNRTFYFPDDVTPDTGNFLFVSNFGSTVQTDWSTGATWSNSTRTLTLLGQLNTQLGLNLSNTSNQAAAQTVAAFTNDASESAFLSLTGSGFTPAGLQTASQLYLKGFAGVDQMAFELVETAGIFRWGFNGTERVRLDNTTGITLTSPGGANTSGLKFANLTSASPAGASTAYLGVDNSGNVVRAAAPGGGGGAPVDATYLTLTLNGTLTNERVFTLADTTLNEVDGGAGGNYTLAVNQANTFAWTAAHTWTTGTTQGNAISLTKASIGSAGQRDSDRFLIQAKANNGTDWAIETRNYINVVSNDGVGSIWTIDGRNTFASASFNTLFTLNISDGSGTFTGGVNAGAASVITSSSAAALSVGPTGATNPTMAVDAVAGGIVLGRSIAASARVLKMQTSDMPFPIEQFVGGGGGGGFADDWTWGIQCNFGGVSPIHPRWGENIENFYVTGGGLRLIEKNWDYTSIDGLTSYRPFNFNLDVDSHNAEMFWRVEKFDIDSRTGTGYIWRVNTTTPLIIHNARTVISAGTTSNQSALTVSGDPGTATFVMFSPSALTSTSAVWQANLPTTSGFNVDTISFSGVGNGGDYQFSQRNAGSGGSRVLLWAGSSGDAYCRFLAATDWTIGNDRSASGAFKICNNDSLSGNDRIVVTTGGNVGFNTSSFGASAANVLAIASGTAPTTYPADAIQLMSADYAAGDARLRVYSENGALPVVIGGNAVLAGRQVVAKTADYTLLIGESNTIFTNTGAAGAVIFTLPGTGVVESYTYQFFRKANQLVTIQCPPGVIVRVGASATSAGGTVTLDAVGSGIWLFQVDASLWFGITTGAATFA